MIKKIIFIAASVAVCCACSDELDKHEGQVQLVATIPDEVNSKTVAYDNGESYSIIWNGTEKVVVNGAESNSISVDPENPKKAVFAFPVIRTPYHSVYPASACRSMSGSECVVTLPPEQKYVEGSFDPDAALMIGYSEDPGKVFFRHAVAYMNVNVTTPDAASVTSISIKGNGSERMSGDFSADFKNSALTSDSTDGSSVTVTAGSDGIPSGESAMIAIPARTYEKGITITVRYGDGKAKSLKSSRTFPAETGVVYYTEVALPDDRMFIEGLGDMPIESMDTWFEEAVISTSEKKSLSLTPFMKLNQSAGALNSHADGYERSSLKMMYSTLQTMGKEEGYRYPHYARIRKMSDGSYIQMWQTPSDADVNAGSKNGKDVYYSLSNDFTTWNEPAELFKSKSVYYDTFNRDTRHYSNGNGIVLSNGDFLAVACFRTPEIYNDESYKSYQGIAIKRSTDCGKSWSTEQIIYNGPCWEPHLMEVEQGVIHCYFAESRPWISGSHSGTSLVVSNDGGTTWTPSVGSDPYRVMRKKWYSEKDDTYFYTDQMAVGIQLNGTAQLAFAVECVDSRNASNKETNSTSVVYSPEDGQWDYLEGDEEASCERLDKVGTGGAPYLVQFHSGETLLTYSDPSDNKMYYKIGNELAGDFSQTARLVLPYKGSWGGMEMESPHSVLATRYSSENSIPALSRARFALNHNMKASAGAHVADADNSDWKNTDDALYLGSVSNTEGTLRCAQDSKNIYFLVEVSEKNLTSDDYVTVMMSQDDGSGNVKSGARRIKAGPLGLVSVQKYSAGTWVDSEMGAVVACAYDGTLDSSDQDNGYLVEIAVSKTSFDAAEGRILINFAMSSNDASGSLVGEDAISASDKLTSGWIEVNGL